LRDIIDIQWKALTSLAGWWNSLERLATVDASLEFLGLGNDAAELVLKAADGTSAIKSAHHLKLLLRDARVAECHEEHGDAVGGYHRLSIVCGGMVADTRVRLSGV